MLAIEVEFLMGRAMLSRWGERSEAEWPPHPQRLFSALVAAQCELACGQSGEDALRWLETLGAPEIRATTAPFFRMSPSYFVPINDEPLKADKGRADFRHVLERRNRQERFFPAVLPDDPVVTYQWKDSPGLDVHRDALKLLAEGITYLGHSAAPVRACLRVQPVEPSFWPAEDGRLLLRVPSRGRFDRLLRTHELRTRDEAMQPPLGRLEPYSSRAAIPHGLFSPKAIVVAFRSGPKLGLDSTLPLMQHVRDALLSRLQSSSPEIISGHATDGQPSRQPHLAIAPLAFVNSRYADGSIKGIAFILPTGAGPDIERRLYSVLTAPWNLQLGLLGSIQIQLVDETEREIESLTFENYARESASWGTVTPIVLDRHPKKNGLTAEAIIANACSNIGLPSPCEIRCGSVSAISGAPRAGDFHGRAKQVDKRIRVHVVLSFPEPVGGPILLGAGRFAGLGLCRPLSSGRS